MEEPAVSLDLLETTYPGLSVVGTSVKMCASETLPTTLPHRRIWTRGKDAPAGTRARPGQDFDGISQAWWGSFKRVTWLSESLLHTLRSS